MEREKIKRKLHVCVSKTEIAKDKDVRIYLKTSQKYRFR